MFWQINLFVNYVIFYDDDLHFDFYFIRIVCKSEKSAVSSFEEALFPIFQGILQQDIVEFIPYVFQMLTLLLETRKDCGDIPEPYWSLFPFLLAPPLWERSSNTTPLIRLLCAYIRQGSRQIEIMGKLVNKYIIK